MKNDNETLGLVPSLGLTIQNLLTEAYNLVLLVNRLLCYLAASSCELCNDLPEFTQYSSETWRPSRGVLVDAHYKAQKRHFFDGSFVFL